MGEKPTISDDILVLGDIIQNLTDYGGKEQPYDRAVKNPSGWEYRYVKSYRTRWGYNILDQLVVAKWMLAEIVKRIANIKDEDIDIEAMTAALVTDARAEADKIIKKAEFTATKLVNDAKRDAAKQCKIMRGELEAGLKSLKEMQDVLIRDNERFIQSEIDRRMDAMVGKSSTLRRKRSMALTPNQKLVVVDA
jgi:F0F1-type ATP synthase membrane subunit b/b'